MTCNQRGSRHTTGDDEVRVATARLCLRSLLPIPPVSFLYSMYCANRTSKICREMVRYRNFTRLSPTRMFFSSVSIPSFFNNPLNTLRDMIRDSPLLSAHMQYLLYHSDVDFSLISSSSLSLSFSCILRSHFTTLLVCFVLSSFLYFVRGNACGLNPAKSARAR